MKKALLFALILGIATVANAKSVRGHVKKNGTYVAPHQKTNPNHSKYDNYSTKGNKNPYTGKKGTKDPMKPKK